MIVNADITLYNRRLDKTTRQYIYKRTVLCGVHWYTDQKVAVSDKGLDSADSIKIRIPMAERRETTAMTAEEKMVRAVRTAETAGTTMKAGTIIPRAAAPAHLHRKWQR